MGTGSPHRVVGLSYEPGQPLPRVVLKGVGPIASHIEREFLKSRSSHRVVKDKGLLSSLFRLPMDSEISPNLYELVAIILVHVFAVEAKLKEETRG